MSMMYVYLRDNNHVVGKYSSDQKLEFLYYHSPEMLDRLDSVQCSTNIDDYENYKVHDGELVRFSNIEIEEKMKYNKILTEDERVINKLKPTHEEVKKAETTIEILSVMQEVL